MRWIPVAVVAVASAACLGSASTTTPQTHPTTTGQTGGVPGQSDCPGPVEGTPPHLSVVSGPAGIHPVLSGVVAHGRGEGGQRVPPITRVTAWWNLSPDHWPTALGSSPWPSRPGAPVIGVGQQHIAKGCRYAIRLTVPPAVPGAYRIAVLVSNKTSGTIQGAATFTVTAPSHQWLNVTTDSGVAVHYPAAWYGQVQQAVNAAISSFPIHSPTLTQRENPAAGALVYIYDAPPTRIAALNQPPRPPGHLRLTHFQPNWEGIGAAYRIEFHDHGHDVIAFVSLGDDATLHTRHQAVRILNSIHVWPNLTRNWIRYGS